MNRNPLHLAVPAWLLLAAMAVPASAQDTSPSSPAAPAAGDTAQPAATPDPRAFRNPDLAPAEQEAADAKFRKELEMARIDSLHLNENPRFYLHAEPGSVHRTAAEVARTVRHCDSLVTAIPPGDWDIFLIAAGHDLLNAVSFSFGWPADWVVEGFTLSPDLKTPFSMGNLRAQDLRPMMVAFDCVANAAKKEHVPPAARSELGDVVVIGKLSMMATSPGSLTLLDHADERYGSPKVVNCWNRTRDVPIPARGRIDVGSGPGLRPCDAGGPLAPNLMSLLESTAGDSGGVEKP